MFLVAPSCCSLCCSPLKSLQYTPISRVLFALLCNKTCSKTQLFLGPCQQETKGSFHFPPKNIPQVHPPGRACLPCQGDEHTCAWELTPSGPGMWSHFHHQMGREVITGSVPPAEAGDKPIRATIPSCLHVGPSQNILKLLTNLNRVDNIK